MKAPGASPRVMAVVSAFNEEATIAETVRTLARVDQVGDVVVLDDGSTDETSRVAGVAGARVLRSPRNRGKGRALESAMDSLGPAEVYLFVDGDVGGSARHMKPLVDRVLAGRAELAIARLPKSQGGGFGLVKRLSAFLIGICSPFRAAEPLSGQRAITAEALEGSRPLARGFGVEAGMTIDVVRLGFRVQELPASMWHRPTGRGVRGFAHRAGQGVDIFTAAAPRLLRLR